MVQLMWMTLHFLFWDYTETKPAEELTWRNLRAFLTNTDAAVLNQIAIWGTVSPGTNDDSIENFWDYFSGMVLF